MLLFLQELRALAMETGGNSDIPWRKPGEEAQGSQEFAPGIPDTKASEAVQRNPEQEQDPIDSHQASLRSVLKSTDPQVPLPSHLLFHSSESSLHPQQGLHSPASLDLFICPPPLCSQPQPYDQLFHQMSLPTSEQPLCP